MRQPDTTRSQAALQQHVVEATTICTLALPHIRQLLPEPNGRPQTGTIGRHSPASSEPWQGQAAAVYWMIHFGARRLEEQLRDALDFLPRDTPRGGSEANTIAALEQIARYAAAIPLDHLAATVRALDAWVNAVDRLDDADGAEEWRPLPRTPGQLIPCPYCRTLALRMNLARETVRCFNPPCRDTDGNSPVARIVRGLMSGDTQLVFRDGREVDYREVAESPEVAL